MEWPTMVGVRVLADVIAMSSRWNSHWVNLFQLEFWTVAQNIITYMRQMVLQYEGYIGESARTFAERFKEHQKGPSPIYDHSNISGHNVTIDNFSIVGREDQNLMRTIKEALYIRVNNPSLNKNIGKYHLPYIWDEVLCNSPELKLKQIDPMAIPSATHGYNICQHPHTHHSRPFHLPPW